MIQLSKNYSLPERVEEIIPIKVVGVGGAGSNVLDRIVLDGMEKNDLITINTDVQSLASSVAPRKVQLGRSTTRGLGGGTGSGAAPVVAQLAREAGSLVIAVATLPFSFEGKRRAAQAQEALSRLNEITNAVICFENDRIGDMVAPKAGIHQAFAVADMTVSQSVRSIVNLIQRPGLIRIGFDDLFTVLRSQNGRCLFGFGESDSDNRAHDALAQALKNPLMDRGRMLADAAHVLVQVAGGPAMTLSEVEILMNELGRHVRDHTQILFGTAVDGRMGNRLSVTIISSLAADDAIESETMRAPREPFLAPPPPILEQPHPAPPNVDTLPDHSGDKDSSGGEPEPVIEEVQPGPKDLIPFHQPATTQTAPEPAPAIKKPAAAPRLIPPKRKPVPTNEPKPPAEANLLLSRVRTSTFPPSYERISE